MQIAGVVSRTQQFHLDVDPLIREQLMLAAGSGTGLGARIAAATRNPHGSTSRDIAIAATQSYLPSPTSARGELAWMHRIAATRTPDGIAAASWLSDSATQEMIESGLREYARIAGPVQARRGAKLVEDIVTYAEHMGRAMKKSVRRDRPFVTDPTLPVVITPPPSDNFSFPSGHSTAAFAAAAVLGALVPAQRGAFLETAIQIAYSRTYGGVHYPSDILAGAALGSAAATAALIWRNAGTDLPKPHAAVMAELAA